MPLPLAPLVPIALRLGAVAALGYAARRLVVAHTHVGRTDQRAEDALDALDEGIALHKPVDRAEAGVTQTNSAARAVRVIRIGGRRIEIDVAVIGRLRLKKG